MSDYKTKLTSIEGIGSKTANRIMTAYPTEESLLEALKSEAPNPRKLEENVMDLLKKNYSFNPVDINPVEDPSMVISTEGEDAKDGIQSPEHDTLQPTEDDLGVPPPPADIPSAETLTPKKNAPNLGSNPVMVCNIAGYDLMLFGGRMKFIIHRGARVPLGTIPGWVKIHPDWAQWKRDKNITFEHMKKS